jgi:spoIIIJ-associated protein
VDDTRQMDQTAVADEPTTEVLVPTTEQDHEAEPAAEAAAVDEAVAVDEVEVTDEAAQTDDDADDDDDDDDDEEGSDEGPTSRLEVEAEVAADYLEELLDIADLDGDIDTYVDADRAHVSVLTETDALVGPNGEVLEALQELSRLAVLTETGDRSRLMLDVAGYRERRRKVLTDLAGDAVTEVKESSERVALGAMNAFERKVVHDVVAAAGLSSESEGEEPNRHVVVLPVA